MAIRCTCAMYSVPVPVQATATAHMRCAAFQLHQLYTIRTLLQACACKEGGRSCGWRGSLDGAWLLACNQTHEPNWGCSWLRGLLPAIMGMQIRAAP